MTILEWFKTIHHPIGWNPTYQYRLITTELVYTHLAITKLQTPMSLTTRALSYIKHRLQNEKCSLPLLATKDLKHLYYPQKGSTSKHGPLEFTNAIFSTSPCMTKMQQNHACALKISKAFIFALPIYRFAWCKRSKSHLRLAFPTLLVYFLPHNVPLPTCFCTCMNTFNWWYIHRSSDFENSTFTHMGLKPHHFKNQVLGIYIHFSSSWNQWL